MSPAAPRPSIAGSIARYSLAFFVLVMAFGASLPEDPTTLPADVDRLAMLDVSLGLLAILALPLRRRYPLALIVGISLLLPLSVSVLGAWLIAGASFGRHRRYTASAFVVLLATLGSVVYELYHPLPAYAALGPGRISPVAAVLNGLLAHTLALTIGFYTGARTALVTSLRARAETAERERAAEAARAEAVEREHASRAAAARVAERTRIAREMHDVLAHRISTVAMHAGALSYRTDLTPEQVRSAATLINEHAHQAIVDLRAVLGVLRDDDQDSTDALSTPEPPQPTLAAVPDLVQESLDAGQDVTLHLDDALRSHTIPDSLGRHVYRAVQECLTNARKHAPDAPVTVDVSLESGTAEQRLLVEVSNPLPREPSTTALPSSGMGLIGLAERADLAGGHLTHGPRGNRYVTRLTVPLPERSTP
ncbi:MAG: histidine kinase [Mobilicoccus sp.]|nr:histidine kinase [Mobilicoccus sp.]